MALSKSDIFVLAPFLIKSLMLCNILKHSANTPIYPDSQKAQDTRVSIRKMYIKESIFSKNIDSRASAANPVFCTRCKIPFLKLIKILFVPGFLLNILVLVYLFFQVVINCFIRLCHNRNV
mgnify:CR=1 FL=1